MRRSRNPHDDTASLVETTDEGRSALQKVFPALMAAHEAIAVHLDRPLEQMREDLAPLILALHAAVGRSYCEVGQYLLRSSSSRPGGVTSPQQAAVIAVILVALCACGTVAGASPAPQLLKRVDTRGQQPCGGAILAGLHDDNYKGSGTIARLIRQEQLRVVKTRYVGGGPCGVVAGGGFLWVELFSESAVAGESESEDAQGHEADLGGPGAPWDVASASGAIEDVKLYAGTVSRIDPRRLRVVKTIRTGNRRAASAPARLRAGGLPGHRPHLPDQPGDQPGHADRDRQGRLGLRRSAEDSIFVSNEVDGSVTKVDPATNAIVSTVKVERQADGVRADGLESIRTRRTARSRCSTWPRTRSSRACIRAASRS